MTGKPAHCLSHAPAGVQCAPAADTTAHKERWRVGERNGTGSVDITAMTYSTYRVDYTLDSSAWS